MQLTVNGHTVDVPIHVTTIRLLLDHLQLNKELAIVELNRVILQKDERDEATIQPDDYIEIVQFVGGG